MLGCRDVVKILRETLEVHFKISETIELKTKEGYAVQYIYFSKMLILIMWQLRISLFELFNKQINEHTSVYIFYLCRDFLKRFKNRSFLKN